jgi:anionic cell wall polymer biosynthesis LytR-Cps2A-Psr (LCP) family protein
MVDFAKILTNTDIDSIQKIMIPGKGDTPNGTYYYYPDEEKTLELLLSVYYNKVP